MQNDAQRACAAAAAAGDTATLGELLRAHPTLTSAPLDAESRTALHIAAMADRLTACKYLLGRWRCDAHVPDSAGRTPLSYSRSREVLLLLLHGAPPPVDGEKSMTALRTAVATVVGTSSSAEHSHTHDEHCHDDDGA